MKKDGRCQIGEVAKKTSSSIHAIRYYEKLRLIHEAQRSAGGFRLYPAETIERILFIKKAQSFGLSLEEIKKILCCGDKAFEPCCALVTEIFTDKIREFEIKIAELQKTKKRLKGLIASWAKRGTRRDKGKKS